MDQKLGRQSLRRLRRRWEVNIKMDIRKCQKLFIQINRKLKLKKKSCLLCVYSTNPWALVFGFCSYKHVFTTLNKKTVSDTVSDPISGIPKSGRT
jgi:hypothetical protein